MVWMESIHIFFFICDKGSPRAVFCRQMKLKIANGDIGEAQRDP
jgi:hypothetical protein